MFDVARVASGFATKLTRSVTAAAVLTLSAGAASAQPAMDETSQEAAAKFVESFQTWAIEWSEPEFGEVASLMQGSWKTSEPILDAEGEPVDFVVTFTPVKANGLSDTVYVEAARADALDQPTHQALLEFYKRDSVIRIRTLEVRETVRAGAMTGMWALPQLFPKFSPDELLGTLDMEVRSDGSGGYVAATPHPYPTARGGAYEMTSELMITRDGLKTADRGFGKDGSQVWGPGAGETY
ncbi:MAG: CpcT/CpeT family chromophore lyase, partial [Planctomycetota bacterium]